MNDYNFDKRYGGKSGTSTTKKQAVLSEKRDNLIYEDIFDLDKYQILKPERKVIKYVQIKSD